MKLDDLRMWGKSSKSLNLSQVVDLLKEICQRSVGTIVLTYLVNGVEMILHTLYCYILACLDALCFEHL